MLSPFRAALAPMPRCPNKPRSPQSLNLSVTSVTSVRCLPRFVQFSPPSSGVQTSPDPPDLLTLCDLRDLCAMPSPFRVVLAHKPRGPKNP
jgi:hypothetical protein